MEIGAKIKNARIAKGLTQEELGALVGVQKSAIAKYENGRVVNIKRSTLQGLATALDLKGSELISDINDLDTKKEKSTAADDGLSKTKQELMDFIRTLPEESVQVLLQVARSIKQ